MEVEGSHTGVQWSCHEGKGMGYVALDGVVDTDDGHHRPSDKQRLECYNMLAHAIVPRSVRLKACADANRCASDVKTVQAIPRLIGSRNLSVLYKARGT